VSCARAAFITSEASQRDEHHQGHGFVEAVHKQVYVLAHLQRLVGRARHHQVFGQALLNIGERRVNSRAEFVDLFTRTHLREERDGARAMPLSFGVAPVVIVQEARRIVITAHHIRDVAQVNRRAIGRGHGYVADFLFALEFAGRVDRQVFAAGFELSAGHGDIACAQDVGQFGSLEAISRQPFLRVVEEDPFVEQPRARDFGNRGERLEGLLDLVGELVEFAVTVLVARHRRQPLSRLARIADHGERPGVGMKFGGLQLLAHKLLGSIQQGGVIQ
jgi:hypothetical protein